MMKTMLRRIKADAKYIFINRFLIFFPSWRIRRFFLRLSGMKIGRDSRIAVGTTVIQPESIVIGDRTFINEYCHLDGRGGLSIGNDVSVSIYTKIITASHKANSPTFEYYQKQTVIEDHVWIGCGAIILDDTILKKGCVIGAGCVFKGTADSKAIYVGNPARQIKNRELREDYNLSYRPFFR